MPVSPKLFRSSTDSVRLLVRIGLICISLYVFLVGLTILFQKYFIFFPTTLDKSFAYQHPETTEEVFLTTRDGEVVNGIFVRGESRFVILYFHGNAGDLSQWQLLTEDFNSFGYNVLMIDYRGYGKSTGKISEEGMYMDGQAAFDFLVKVKGFKPDEILVYGRSIGTGVATHIASINTVKHLILEAPYVSLKKLVQQKVPFLFPSLWLSFEFNSLENLKSIRCPLLLIHGDRDQVIPVQHSYELFNAYQGEKQLVVIKGGPHNNLNVYDEYFSAIRSLTEKGL